MKSRLVALLAVLFVVACSDGGGGAPLEADFVATFEQPTTGPTSCPVTEIRFNDRSSGDPTSWRWTFDDGSSSDEQNPTWETNTVVAEVTLTVARGSSEDTTTKQVTTHEC